MSLITYSKNPGSLIWMAHRFQNPAMELYLVWPTALITIIQVCWLLVQVKTDFV